MLAGKEPSALFVTVSNKPAKYIIYNIFRYKCLHRYTQDS